MSIFEAVKQTVTTRQAAERYGIRVERNGMCRCPFHEDKTPSMKLDRRYYCFGCGVTGDVIDFVSRLRGIGNKEAAILLVQDFAIPYEDGTGKMSKPRQQNTDEQNYQHMERYCFRVLLDYYRLLCRWKEDYARRRRRTVIIRALEKPCRSSRWLNICWTSCWAGICRRGHPL